MEVEAAADFLPWAEARQLKGFENGEWAAFLHRPDPHLLLVDVRGLELAIMGVQLEPESDLTTCQGSLLLELSATADHLKWTSLDRLRRWRFNAGGKYDWAAGYFARMTSAANAKVLCNFRGLESAIIRGDYDPARRKHLRSVA